MFGSNGEFKTKNEAQYHTLDMRRVLGVNYFQCSSSADRTAPTQLLISSMRDALSGIFDVGDASDNNLSRDTR